jgi:hypothetical protein
MSQIRSLVALVTIAALAFHVNYARAAAFSGGIVVERIGGDADFMSGTAQVAGTATPIFLDEFSLSTGNRIQTIALPATDPDGAGAQHQITENGNASNIGFVQRSADGHYLVAMGYAVDVDSTGLVGSSTTNNRIIARIAANGTVDTSTGYTDANSVDVNLNGTPRSATSADGSSFYFITANATSGMRLLPSFGSVVDTTLRAGGENSTGRTVSIYGGRLFFSSSANNSLTSVTNASGGLPTTDDPTNIKTPLLALTDNSNPEAFVLLDRDANISFDGTGLDTLYIANLNTIDTSNTNPTGSSNTGGIQKFTFDGTTWNQQITYNSGLSSDNTVPVFGGINGLTFAGVDGSNNPILYATTRAGANVGNALVKLVDSGPSAAFTVVATAPVNTVLRGVTLAPFTAGVPGDYNGNGVVDAADYVLWRKNPANFGGDPGGYNTWRAHFGSAVGSLATGVPEPGLTPLLSIAALGLANWRHRARKLGRRNIVTFAVPH